MPTQFHHRQSPPFVETSYDAKKSVGETAERKFHTYEQF